MPKLTDLFIEKLPLTNQRVTHWDTLLPAFGVRVGARTKTFIVVDSAGIRRAIGHYPKINLKDAREAARKRMSGSTPSPESFQTVLDAYIDSHVKKNWSAQSGAEIERLLRKHFPFGKRDISSITKRDVAIEIQKIESQSVGNHANLAIKLLFNWAERNGFNDHNPLKSLPQPYKEESRDRVLTPQELRSIWCSSKQLDDYGRLVRLLILTGQRRGEMAAIQKSWLKDDTIEIPSMKTKSKRTHIIPLTENAKALLRDLPLQLKHWDREKKELDKLCEIRDWVLHDCRRSFATYLAQLDVAPHIIEFLLNHTNPQLMGGFVGLTYNRHKYLPQMREALNKYEGWLAPVIGDPLS